MSDSSNRSKLRKTLTNEERLNIARLVTDKKCSTTAVARKFGVCGDSVRRAVKRKSELEEGLEQGEIKKKKTKRERKPQYPEVDNF